MPIRSPAERRPCRGRYRAAQAARPIDAWLFATRRPPSPSRRCLTGLGSPEKLLSKPAEPANGAVRFEGEYEELAFQDVLARRDIAKRVVVPVLQGQIETAPRDRQAVLFRADDSFAVGGILISAGIRFQCLCTGSSQSIRPSPIKM